MTAVSAIGKKHTARVRTARLRPAQLAVYKVRLEQIVNYCREKTVSGKPDFSSIKSDIVDEVSEAHEIYVQMVKHSSRISVLRQSQAALQRIEKGNYGVCSDCSGPITAKRLDAVPWSDLCVQCQEAAERNNP